MVALNLRTEDFSTRCQAASLEALRSGYLERILPGAARRGRELVAATIHGGRGDSFSLNLATGAWADFASGQKGGDLIALLAARDGTTQGQALERLENELGLSRPLPPKPNKSLPKAPVAGPPTKVWVYADAEGNALYEARRWEKPGHVKSCLTHGLANQPRVPLYLPQIRAAIAEGRPVYLAEGEPKADLLWSWGLPGTSIIGGAKGWKPEIAGWFAGADVVILPDADEPGREFAAKVAAELLGAGARGVKIVALPGAGFSGYDLVDWAKDGGTAEDLRSLVDETSAAYSPPPSGLTNGAPKALRPMEKVDLWAGSGPAILERGPQPYDWLIQDSLRRNQLGVIAGPSGCGKGLFALQLQMALTLGLSAFENWETEEPARTLLISNEDDQIVLDNRVNAIWDSLTETERKPERLANLAALSVKGRTSLGRADKSQLTSTENFEDLKKIVAEFKPDLLILDTLAQFGGFEENDNVLMTDYCGLLNEIIYAFKCNIIMIHHTSKTAGDLPDKESLLSSVLTQTALRGASALAGAARWVLLMSQLSAELANKIFGAPAKDKPPGTYLAARVAKKNAGPVEDRIYLERGDHGLMWRVEPAAKRGNEEEAKEDAYSLLAEVDKRGQNMESPLSVTGARKIFGWSLKRAGAAVDKAVETGLLETGQRKKRGGGRCLARKMETA